MQLWSSIINHKMFLAFQRMQSVITKVSVKSWQDYQRILRTNSTREMRHEEKAKMDFGPKNGSSVWPLCMTYMAWRRQLRVIKIAIPWYILSEIWLVKLYFIKKRTIRFGNQVPRTTAQIFASAKNSLKVSAKARKLSTPPMTFPDCEKNHQNVKWEKVPRTAL